MICRLPPLEPWLGENLIRKKTGIAQFCKKSKAFIASKPQDDRPGRQETSYSSQIMRASYRSPCNSVKQFSRKMSRKQVTSTKIEISKGLYICG